MGAGDDLAPQDHSMTSSARPSSGSGMVSPSDLAVDDQPHIRELLHRQIGGLLAFEDPTGIRCRFGGRFP
jgi:hypothetical protein